MPHNFLSVTKSGESAIVSTWGNDACHIILRGASTSPNYDAGHVAEVIAKLKAAELLPHLMVDCSHGNRQKDYRQQPAVAEDLCRQVADGSTSVVAVMIESNLVKGNQKVEAGEDLVHGQSITDSCVSWETTEKMLEGLARAARRRRGGKP